MRSRPSGFIRLSFVMLLLAGQVAFALPAAAQDDEELAGVDGASYASPTFGYSLSWDESLWEVADASSEDGYDLLYLSHERADLYVEGTYFYEGDPEACVDGEAARTAESAGVESLSLELDADGNEKYGIEEEYAYAFLEVPSEEDPESVGYIAYIECDVLVAESAVLIISAFYAPDDEDAGLDIDDVLATIEISAAETPQFDSSSLEQIARLAANDIDEYWEGVFEEMGETYVPAKYITYQGVVETGCGDATSGYDGPFYCGEDETVYLDLDSLSTEILPFGVVVIEVVIAHEIAHHVQGQLGLNGCTLDECGDPGQSLAYELQADCLAGAWTQDAGSRGVITEKDLERVSTAVTTYFGDPPGTSQDDPDAHGSGEVRDLLFNTGFEDGLAACGVEV